MKINENTTSAYVIMRNMTSNTMYILQDLYAFVFNGITFKVSL